MAGYQMLFFKGILMTGCVIRSLVQTCYTHAPFLTLNHTSLTGIRDRQSAWPFAKSIPIPKSYTWDRLWRIICGNLPSQNLAYMNIILNWKVGRASTDWSTLIDPYKNNKDIP